VRRCAGGSLEYGSWSNLTLVLKILIADDHAILRKGLREILSRALPDIVCGEARNADEVLRAVRSEHWDLVLLDLTMPGRSGLDVLRDLKTEKPSLSVLVLSMQSEVHYGKRVLKAGAAGYLHKDSPPEELINAIRKVISGGRYVSPVLAERLALDVSTGTEQLPHERLSDRELEVLRMITAGKQLSKIAEELHLSVTTVSTYRARILEKLDLNTTAELVHYGIANNLGGG
jgi:two-component system, NarL family, invasion response regulator UvrY